MTAKKSTPPSEPKPPRRRLIFSPKKLLGLSLLSIAIYPALPARPPDQKLWDRLGLTVEEDYGWSVSIRHKLWAYLGLETEKVPPGLAIVKAEGLAKSSNITTAMRLTQIAARVPGEEGPNGSILPVESVATVEQAESALKRAIFAGESRGLEQMEINLGVETPGRPLVPHSFTIPLNRLLPPP